MGHCIIKTVAEMKMH